MKWLRLRLERERERAARLQEARRDERLWQQAALSDALERAIQSAYPHIEVEVGYTRQRYRVIKGPPLLLGRAYTPDQLRAEIRNMQCLAHLRDINHGQADQPHVPER